MQQAEAPVHKNENKASWIGKENGQSKQTGAAQAPVWISLGRF
jgi:hypothetical protein